MFLLILRGGEPEGLFKDLLLVAFFSYGLKPGYGADGQLLGLRVVGVILQDAGHRGSELILVGLEDIKGLTEMQGAEVAFANGQFT